MELLWVGVDEIAFSEKSTEMRIENLARAVDQTVVLIG